MKAAIILFKAPPPNQLLLLLFLSGPCMMLALCPPPPWETELSKVLSPGWSPPPSLRGSGQPHMAGDSCWFH